MNLNNLSGDFTGYYSYKNINDLDHEMHCSLVFFDDGRVVGHGVDDINPFHFEGTVNIEDNSVKLFKKYPTHTVDYQGTLVNANNCISISGIWNINGIMSSAGAFTLRKGHNLASINADINHIEEVLKAQLTKVKEL